jgi:hypothetical protein
MKSSYTKSLILHLLRLNLFLLSFLILAACQIDQSVNLIKEKLFSDDEEISDLKNDKEVEVKTNLKNSTDNSKNKKNLRPSKDIDQTKLIKPKTKTKAKENKSEESSNLAFKEMGKGRDTDNNIISFFTKIFDSEDEESLTSKVEIEKQSKSIENKINEKTEDIQETAVTEKAELTRNTPVDNFAIKKEESVQEEEIDNINIENKDNLEEENFAFLQLRSSKKKKQVEITENDNLVGLLLPLTGAKSDAGNIVINSLRYSMLLKPNQLNFKIFDTKGAPEGAIEAAKRGIENDVKTFIGPIFSDETRELKEYFKKNDDLTFFSLSPDLSNMSKNIIVSGQNPEEQISCIIQQFAEDRSNKILLVYHADKYGYVIRDSFSKFVESYKVSQFANVQFFELQQNANLNDEIKKLSKFEERKRRLKNEILKIKNDKTLEKSLKKKQVNSLERRLTLDTPFDSIVIASEGDSLLEILSHFAFYDINADNTNIYGTSLWEDTDKKDNVYNGTFYVTSLKDKSEEFVKNFKNVFARDPMSLNFYIHDLIGLVQNFKDQNKNEKLNKVFYGEFSNSKIQPGLLEREVYIRKINGDEKTEEVSSCRLDEI